MMETVRHLWVLSLSNSATVHDAMPLSHQPMGVSMEDGI